MSTVYGNLILVTEVKLRIVWREFTHNVITTIEGKLAVATMVAAPFLMKSLLVSSALRQASMDEDCGWVVLWTAHLFMMAALVLFVAARTARSLVVDRREEALAHYPHARQGLAAFHLWGEIVTPTTFMLLALFYLFYGPLVSRLAVQPRPRHAPPCDRAHRRCPGLGSRGLPAHAPHARAETDMGAKDFPHDLVPWCAGLCWSWPRAVDSYGLEIQAAGAYLLS